MKPFPVKPWSYRFDPKGHVHVLPPRPSTGHVLTPFCWCLPFLVDNINGRPPIWSHEPLIRPRPHSGAPPGEKPASDAPRRSGRVR